MPDPLLPLAIEAHSKADEDKLSQGLARLVAEDPTMRLEQNQDTHQVVLWCLGEAHADVALERLRTRYGVQVDVVPHKVSLRETFGGKAGRARTACEAVRRARPVRDLRDRGGAAARAARASSSSTRSSAARCRGSSSRPWRRAYGPRPRAGSRPGYPLVDVRSRCSTARRTRWTPPTPRSRRRARWRCARPRPTRGSICWSRWPRSSVLVRDEYVGAGDERPVRAARPGASAPSRPAAGAPWSGPRCRRSRSAGTPSICGPSRTAPARFSRSYARHEPMPPQVAEKVREQAENGA